ncbi:MAG TPA: BON domain-containing protein [Nitrospira sp.]|nr:BON domain-containing protein [Nitrospira sp.]
MWNELRFAEWPLMYQRVRMTSTVMLLLSSACEGDTYRAIMEKAQAGYTDVVTADDRLYRLRLENALAANPALSGLALSTYVFMDRAYVIGHVESADQAKQVFETAREVRGLRSVDAFLPVKHPASHDVGPISDQEIKSQIESALVLTPGVVYGRVNLEVLDGRVVLIGVVSGNEERTRAEQVAKKTSGVKGVTNWLLLPETEYLAIRSQL